MEKNEAIRKISSIIMSSVTHGYDIRESGENWFYIQTYEAYKISSICKQLNNAGFPAVVQDNTYLRVLLLKQD